jgi:hypothetical protein
MTPQTVSRALRPVGGVTVRDLVSLPRPASPWLATSRVDAARFLAQNRA